MLHKLNLRPYQKEAIASLPESGSAIINMFCGAGKTVTFPHVPRRGRLLVLSHRFELVRQCTKYFDCPVGIEEARLHSNGEEVVSASMQSMARRLNRYKPDDFDVVIVDECHLAGNASYHKILEYFKPRLLVGYSATVNRFDGVRLDDLFSDICYERDLIWGIENKYLVPLDCLRVQIGYDISRVALKMGEYAIGELEKAVNIEGANKAIADAYRRYARGRTVIFCCSVAHARAVAAEIPGAVPVIGGEKREHILKAFENNDITCMTNVDVLSVGTDLPCIETVIMARPTQNSLWYTQAVGRALRLYPGKERALLIDCVGVSKLAICTAPSLIGVDMQGIPAPEEIEGHLFDLPELIEKQMDTPKCWIKNVEIVNLWAKAKKFNLHNINFFKTAKGALVLSKPKFVIPPANKLGRVMWNGKETPLQRVLDEVYMALCSNHQDSAYVWNLTLAKKWGEYRATDKQLEMVKRFLPDFDTDGLTKFEAGQLLTRCFYKGAA